MAWLHCRESEIRPARLSYGEMPLIMHRDADHPAGIVRNQPASVVPLKHFCPFFEAVAQQASELVKT
ncbi:hypothetical protein [uncultured Desulfovibrio sp.]|uniref:hypothetical protein n=1 Tax=uncultured Desulfovibrio sp. TaxID=167968 RepID=UPI002605079F|nr:hypothetical protein [uncultured Desulfovibrio sp.]